MKINQTNVHLEIGSGRIVYQNGFELCRMPATCVTSGWIEKAEKIVRSVNSHEALLEAVKLAREHVAAWRNSVNAEDWQRGQTMLRLETVLAEAIAQAEEKS